MIYIISAIIWLIIAYLFNFSFIGWIIGLIISFLFKEFIGPLFILKTDDRILNSNINNSSKNYNPVELSQLLKNFIISEKGVYKNCVNYYHKTKGKLTNSDIHFNISAVKCDYEISELRFKIIYDSKNRGWCKDIIFNGKNLDFFGDDIGVNYFANNGVDSEAFFCIPIKSNHRKFFTTDNGEIIFVFDKSNESIIVNNSLLQALTETFDLCLSLNK